MSNCRAQFAIDLAVLLLLGAAIWLTFGRAAGVPFFYDDFPAIVDNESIRTLWPISVPLHAPRETPFAARPIVNLSAAVNYHFGQLSPTGYRLFNMAVHTLNAMLLFLIVRRTLALWQPAAFEHLLPANALALATALVWAVHPLQTEAVCYVTQRTELIMAFWYLLTLYGSLRFFAAESSTAKTGWLAIAVAACLAGMASKEVMASAPLIVLLYDRAFVSGSFQQAWRNSRPLYIGLASTWMVLMILAADAPRSAVAGFHVGVSPIAWWLTQCQVLLLYLRLAIWPWPLSIHYEVPYLTFNQAWPYVATVAALIAGTLFALARNWPSGFLGAWFFVILSPTLIVPIITEVAAERRVYLPLAAAVTFVVLGVCRLWALSRRTTPGGWTSPAVAILLIAAVASFALGTVSNQRLIAYRDPAALWRDTLSKSPNSELAQANLGFALLRAGEDREAMEHLVQAVALNPSAEDAHYSLATLYKKEGRMDDAAKHYGDAARLNPNHAGRHNDFGGALMRLKQFPAAIEQFQQALKLDPSMRTAQYNLALAYAATDRSADAIAEYEHMLERAPDDVDVHFALAKTLLANHQAESAIDHLERALVLAQRAKNDDLVQKIESLLSSVRTNIPPTQTSTTQADK